MRTLLTMSLIAGGIYLAGFEWLPPAARLPLPESIGGWSMPMGAALLLLGVALALVRPNARPALGDGPLVRTLTEAGFRMTPIPHGWQADGAWKGMPLVLRKGIGHEAGRFGRPWTIVAVLPGQPIEPWPFLPEEGLIVERRRDGFSVAMADLSRPERMHRLAERLNQLVLSRS